MNDNKDVNLGHSGVSAANYLLFDAAGAMEVLAFKDDVEATFAKFVRTAGDVPGEALFRWAAARGFHPLPADSWSGLAPDIRLFFDAFVAVVKALTPLIDPPKQHGVVIHPGPARVAVEDTIFRKYGAPGEKIGAHNDPTAPRSTHGLAITPAAPAPVVAAVLVPSEPSAPPIVIDRAALTRFEKGAPPSQAEFMAMTPEERRPYAALFGMGGLEEVFNEPPPAAPAAEGLETVTIEGDVGGEKIAGQVAIGKTAIGKTKGGDKR